MERPSRIACKSEGRGANDGSQTRGSWHRDVGAEGGRRLHWEGKLGLLIGCFPSLDHHYAVMSQLGERFCLYRMDVDGADQHARQSLNHIGGAREMRSELREAVQALYAGIPTDRPLPAYKATSRRKIRVVPPARSA